jgi:hypothetical protein
MYSTGTARLRTPEIALRSYLPVPCAAAPTAVPAGARQPGRKAARGSLAPVALAVAPARSTTGCYDRALRRSIPSGR